MNRDVHINITSQVLQEKLNHVSNIVNSLVNEGRHLNQDEVSSLIAYCINLNECGNDAQKKRWCFQLYKAKSSLETVYRKLGLELVSDKCEITSLNLMKAYTVFNECEAQFRIACQPLLNSPDSYTSFNFMPPMHQVEKSFSEIKLC